MTSHHFPNWAQQKCQQKQGAEEMDLPSQGSFTQYCEAERWPVEDHSPPCLGIWTVNPRGPWGRGSESQKTVHIIQREKAGGQKEQKLEKVVFSFCIPMQP